MQFREFQRLQQREKANLYVSALYDLIYASVPKQGLKRHRTIDKERFGFDSFDDSLDFNWELGWGTDVRVNIKLVKTTEPVTKDGQTVGQVTYGEVTTDIAWSSTTRDIVGANAAIMLYQQALQFITLVQHSFNEKYLIDDTKVSNLD